MVVLDSFVRGRRENLVGALGSGKVRVVEGDAERGLLLVKGSVPGPAGSLVFVRNAVKAPPGSADGGAA